MTPTSTTSTRVKLAKLALQNASKFSREIVRLTVHGSMNWKVAWYGIEGAYQYVAAVASGDVADDATMEHRASVCASCPSRVADDAHPDRLGYCGPAFQDRMNDDNSPTCGCPIEPMVAVASKRCPQHKFQSAKPAQKK